MEPHVKVLRDFSDRFLLVNAVGKGFVRLYYTCSPPIADLIENHDSLWAIIRVSLLPVKCQDIDDPSLTVKNARTSMTRKN